MNRQNTDTRELKLGAYMHIKFAKTCRAETKSSVTVTLGANNVPTY